MLRNKILKQPKECRMSMSQYPLKLIIKLLLPGRLFQKLQLNLHMKENNKLHIQSYAYLQLVSEEIILDFNILLSSFYYLFLIMCLRYYVTIFFHIFQMKSYGKVFLKIIKLSTRKDDQLYSDNFLLIDFFKSIFLASII